MIKVKMMLKDMILQKQGNFNSNGHLCLRNGIKSSTMIITDIFYYSKYGLSYMPWAFLRAT